jgi:hypothetical protein
MTGHRRRLQQLFRIYSESEFLSLLDRPERAWLRHAALLDGHATHDSPSRPSAAAAGLQRIGVITCATLAAAGMWAVAALVVSQSHAAARREIRVAGRRSVGGALAEAISSRRADAATHAVRARARAIESTRGRAEQVSDLGRALARSRAPAVRASRTRARRRAPAGTEAAPSRGAAKPVTPPSVAPATSSRPTSPRLAAVSDAAIAVAAVRAQHDFTFERR